MSEEIMKCSKCGRDPFLIIKTWVNSLGKDVFYKYKIKCDGCKSCAHKCHTKGAATDCWNEAQRLTDKIRGRE